LSIADLQQVEEPVMKVHFIRALEFLLSNVPAEKEDELYEYIEKLKDQVRMNEKIDMGEVVANLLDPKKFGLSQDIVEEFLKHIIGNRPDADKLISGTIEYAKRRIWRKDTV